MPFAAVATACTACCGEPGFVDTRATGAAPSLVVVYPLGSIAAITTGFTTSRPRS